MPSLKKRITFASLGVLSALVVAGSPAHAVDGLIEINQAGALAGGVTLVDTPGFPVSIVSPGSYRLTSDLVVPDTDTNGIVVSRLDDDIDVTIDLNGFAIRGPVECSRQNDVTTCSTSGSGSGILVGTFGVSLTVTNGTVRGMGFDGIDAGFSTARTRIREVTAVSNARHGFTLMLAQLSDSRAELNGQNGVNVSENGALITDCVLHDNGNLGIQATSGVGLRGNTFEGNTAGSYVGGVRLGQNLCGTGLCP